MELAVLPTNQKYIDMTQRVPRPRIVQTGVVSVTNLTKTTVSLIPYSTDFPHHVLDKSDKAVIIRGRLNNIQQTHLRKPLLSIVDEIVFNALKMPCLLMKAPGEEHYFHQYDKVGNVWRVTFMDESECKTLDE